MSEVQTDAKDGEYFQTGIYGKKNDRINQTPYLTWNK